MAINTDGYMNVTGHIVNMKTSDPLHYSNVKPNRPAKDDVSTSFSDMLTTAVNKVNNLQVESEELVQKSIHDPGSVDIHTVRIAALKAETALTFTKTVRDSAIKAFKDLISLR